MKTYQDILTSNADKVTQQTWYVVRQIARAAYRDVIDPSLRTDAEIDFLTCSGDKPIYYEWMGDPNTQVGNGLKANQRFWHPHLALAISNKRAIGFAYTADNTSGGNGLSRIAKHYGPTQKHNYLWVRHIAVLPEYQGQGIGRLLIQDLLQKANPSQPVTAYVWPKEIPGADVKLEQLGFTATGEFEVCPFGDDARPTREVRMLAPTVKGLVHKITSS